MTENQTAERSQSRRTPRPVRTGLVTSDKANKTIKVMMSYSVKHRKYGKILGRRTHVQAHDEDNQARVGDTVEIMECRPMSKTKRWRLLRVVDKAS